MASATISSVARAMAMSGSGELLPRGRRFACAGRRAGRLFAGSICIYSLPPWVRFPLDAPRTARVPKNASMRQPALPADASMFYDTLRRGENQGENRGKRTFCDDFPAKNRSDLTFILWRAKIKMYRNVSFRSCIPSRGRPIHPKACVPTRGDFIGWIGRLRLE